MSDNFKNAKCWLIEKKGEIWLQKKRQKEKDISQNVLCSTEKKFIGLK